MPAGSEWKTLDNGEHVLINSETGEILSGAGIENWKNTGKMTIPKPSEPQPKQSNSSKTITKKEYLSNSKAIKYRKDLIEFHKRELERIHPNDKLNRKAKEDEIAELENAEDYQKWIKENEEYEKENPKVNAEKEKAKDKTENKDKDTKKKITKNYSIAYDDETIEKLNKLGKNWKDKRIYFKDLNNSYYDLENQKWVCDKPETTERALMIAGETDTEKTARFEAEKQARERREEEERQARLKQWGEDKETTKKIKEFIKTSEFSDKVFNSMYKAGIFEDLNIPKGSINAIKNDLFTEAELNAYKNIEKDKPITDVIFDEVKHQLNELNNMYKPSSWNEWVFENKKIRLTTNEGGGGGKDYYDDDFDDMIANTFPKHEQAMMREYYLQKFEKEQAEHDKENGISYMPKEEAWEKYGEEFNKYKSQAKEEAKKKIKEYIKKKLNKANNTETNNTKTNNTKTNNTKITITNKSKDGLDKLESKTNDFLKSNANKLKEEVKEETKADAKIDNNVAKIDSADIDIKTDAEIDNDIEYFIDNLIEYADAKKKFDESKINRDEDGKFAKKNGNKDTDNKDSKDNDINNNDNSEITEDDRVKFISNIDYLISGKSISDSVSENRAEGIKKIIASGRLGTVADIDKDIKYNKELEKTDKDKYNKYKEYKETAEYKEKMKQAINQFEGDTKATAEKLLPENLKAGELILDDKFEYSKVIDKDKIQKLNPIEKAINYFTEKFTNRNKQGFKQYQKEIKDLINKSIPKEISLYRYETEQAGKKRYNLKVGDTIDMSVRSFCDSEKAFENCRALQLRNREPNECVIYKVEGAVKSLEIQSLSQFTSQYEHIVDGDFEITEIREATKLMPKIITIKAKGI
ncbi:hypothetical protein [Brachyspira catarrhinii]|uniref:ADP ribosyltransferase domain-containing protein n=1 Tax=Brachyspira catarrhinii TaxID=2528966 RepID=A0ABY2TU27_9SPIR|nr:hypothetical protein [Brachyspira catarrhinii]TKZ35696.1 hypothetical protein EZH24_03935 [Brachyspira catarrhinii]